MPYNRSKNTIIRMHSYLRDMAENQRDVFFPSAHPQRLAYKIREALSATQFHPEYLHLNYLNAFYEISPVDGGVRARFLGEPQSSPSTLSYTPIRREKADGTVLLANPLTGEQKVEELKSFITPPEIAPSRMKIPEVDALTGVVGAAIKFKYEAEEIYFPHVHLSPEDKHKLWTWGRSSESKWGFIDHEEEGITLTRKPVDESVLWSPE